MVIHTGENPSQCILCDNEIATPLHLNKHMVFHTGEKPSECDNEIAKPVAFYKHMLVHTREKPFLCILCSDNAYRQIGMHLCVKLVMNIVNIVYDNFMHFGYIYVKVFNYLGLFLMGPIHKDFTSHTKVYPIVRTEVR